MPKKKPNKLEQSFLDAWSEHKDEGLPDPLFQHEWSPSTKHIADFAWPDYRVLVEMDGGVFTRQAHGSVSGILRTMRRDNLAAMLGWTLLKFTSADMKQPQATVKMVCATLNNSSRLLVELRRGRGEFKVRQGLLS